MTKGQNFNAPGKGSQIKVEPIREIEDINRIKKLLFANPRNYCIFVVGINTNLRASDLCRLTVRQVIDVKPMGDIEIKEQKTGKLRRISLNSECVNAISMLIEHDRLNMDDHLFMGQRGTITPQTIHAMVKNCTHKLKLKGNYGSHSLRKTWGYHQRVTFDISIPILMTCFNHNTQKQTLDYLGIQPIEIKNVYANVL